MGIEEVCRRLEISVATYHHWNKECGGAEMEAVKHPRKLEKENARLPWLPVVNECSRSTIWQTNDDTKPFVTSCLRVSTSCRKTVTLHPHHATIEASHPLPDQAPELTDGSSRSSRPQLPRATSLSHLNHRHTNITNPQKTKDFYRSVWKT
jgi:hypothetical protein